MRCPNCDTLLSPDDTGGGLGMDGSIQEWWKRHGFKKKRCPVCGWVEK